MAGSNKSRPSSTSSEMFRKRNNPLCPEFPLNLEFGFEVNHLVTNSHIMGNSNSQRSSDMVVPGHDSDCDMGVTSTSDSGLTTTVHTLPTTIDDFMDVIVETGAVEIQTGGSADLDSDLICYLENWEDADVSDDIDPHCQTSAVIVVDELPDRQTFTQTLSKAVNDAPLKTRAYSLTTASCTDNGCESEQRDVGQLSPEHLSEDNGIKVANNCIISSAKISESSDALEVHSEHIMLDVNTNSEAFYGDVVESSPGCVDSLSKSARTVKTPGSALQLNKACAATKQSKVPIVRLERIDKSSEHAAVSVSPVEVKMAAKYYEKEAAKEKRGCRQGQNLKRHRSYLIKHADSLTRLACGTSSGVSEYSNSIPSGSSDEELEGEKLAVYLKKKCVRTTVAGSDSGPSGKCLAENVAAATKESTAVITLHPDGQKNQDPTPEEEAKQLEDRVMRNRAKSKRSRMKKRAYFLGIEKELGEAKEELRDLRKQLLSVEKERDSNKEEVKFLRAALLNQTELADVLKNLMTASARPGSCCRKS